MDHRINLTGLHLLLTYQCTFECDHCFVWGSPWQNGTMTAQLITKIIDQTRQVPSIEWIYFEGGEPFLYYPVLLHGVDYAKRCGYKVGIVTNGYWANEIEDAFLWLKPLEGKIDDLTISSDLYHYDEKTSKQSQFIQQICKTLKIPTGIICIPQPNENLEGGLMFRGRAAVRLASRFETRSKNSLTECPYEDLSDPGRFHVDPLGYVHVCQGIVVGNIDQTALVELISNYDPANHPILSKLVAGGPVRLAEYFHIPAREFYADACQMCYETRSAIRANANPYLQPDQMYGLSN